MANELMIKKRIEVVKETMTAILRRLSSEYERGEIKSPAELQHRVYHSLQKFYESIGFPTFHQIHAWGPPYSSDHNQMMQQILTDIDTLYGEIQYMTEDIRGNFEQVELERQSFTKRISEVETILRRIEANFTELDDVLAFRDDFTSIDRYNKEAVSGTAAYLSADEGILTLNRTNGESFNEYATITILKGDGLPGNTHIVRSTGDSLKFDGEENLHINLADILDQNSDTWFEYELFELTRQAEDITQRKDFRYREPIKWIDRDVESMRCVIQIELPKAKVMNWVSIMPYIPADRGALPSRIEKVVVSDEKGTIKGMGFEELFASGKAFVFPRQKCKTITIYLRQDTSYLTDVGHFYFMEVNKEEVKVMDEKRQFDGIRIHAPVLPAIENIGVSYDTEKDEIVFPLTKYGDTIGNEDSKKKNLFTIPETDDIILAGIEKVPAYRYAVGMRDAVLATYQFANSSQYISTEFISATPIREVQLEADFEVPDIFPDDQDWVRFYISVDKRQSWHEIHPKDVHKEGVKTRYLFNSGTPKDGRLDEVGYIETLSDVYEVEMKIELNRPHDIEDAEFYTPVVDSYEIQALTIEEVM
jgi:hypothetical protein